MDITLLIIDDDVAHRLILRRELRTLVAAATIIECSDLASLQSALRSGPVPPTLAFVDLDLGGQSGIEALKILRRSAPAVIAIILSTSALPNEVAATTAAGAAMHITKPTDPTNLRELLRRSLEAFKIIPHTS